MKAGIAARVFGKVASLNVNIGMISAGGSTAALHFTVDRKDLEKTTRIVHADLFGD